MLLFAIKVVFLQLNNSNPTRLDWVKNNNVIQ